jgi:cytochrome c oxidase subunit II
MRGTVIVESQAEFNAWLATKQPQYLAAMEAKNPKPATPVKADSTVAPGTAKAMH